MVPRNVASISEYVSNSGCSPLPRYNGRSQSSLCAGAPVTTGTADSAGNVRVVPADTSCSPAPQYTVPSTSSAPSTPPTAVSCVGSVTCSTTSVSTRTVVFSMNAGGVSAPAVVRALVYLLAWVSSSTNTGTAT